VKDVFTIKVAANSNPKAVAGSISYALKGDKDNPPRDVEVLAIGAGSTNQALKGIAISRGHIAITGGDLVVRPGFRKGEINGEEKTVMVLRVEVI
jgi:stage V sporulation protein S